MRKPSNTVLVVISLSLSVLLLEGALRVAVRFLPASQPVPAQSQPHLYDAYRTHRLNPAFNTPANTEGRRLHSPDGFRRDNSVEQHKPTNTVRILVMGGSALYGIGSTAPYRFHRYLFNEETITSHLERMLNARMGELHSPWNVEVINCGVIAYRTFHHLVYLNESLLAYQPDIVVNFDGHNDFYTDNNSTQHWLDYGYATAKLVSNVNERDLITPVHLFFRWLADYSLIAGQIEKRLTERLFDKHAAQAFSGKEYVPCLPASRDYQANMENIARQSYLRALWQINKLGQLEGYDHVVFLQPEVVFEERDLLSDADKHIRETTINLLGDDSVNHMSAARRLFPTFFAKFGIPFYDVATLASAQAKKTDLYLDYCHLTPAGAERVARFMEPILWGMVKHRIASPRKE